MQNLHLITKLFGTSLPLPEKAFCARIFSAMKSLGALNLMDKPTCGIISIDGCLERVRFGESHLQIAASSFSPEKVATLNKLIMSDHESGLAGSGYSPVWLIELHETEMAGISPDSSKCAA